MTAEVVVVAVGIFGEVGPVGIVVVKDAGVDKGTTEGVDGVLGVA